MEFSTFEAGKCYKEFKGMYGSKLYAQNGRMYLIISYDDMMDDEIEAFEHASYEVVFKTLGVVSLFTFNFAGHIVDAPIDQFSAEWTGFRDVRKNGVEIPISILICEATDGCLLRIRESVLPQEFCRELGWLWNEHGNEYAGKYSLTAYRERLKEIYDNYTIDALYGRNGDREIKCLV